LGEQRELAVRRRRPAISRLALLAGAFRLVDDDLVLRLLVGDAALAEALAGGAVAGEARLRGGLPFRRELLALEVVLVELVVEDERELGRVVAHPAALQLQLGGVDGLAALLGQLAAELLLVEEGHLGLLGRIDEPVAGALAGAVGVPEEVG